MPRLFRKMILRLQSLFLPDRAAREVDEELHFHLERLIEENAAKGMSPADARYAALRELGGVDQIKEECRDAHRLRVVENLVQDVRYGLRVLRKNPAFAVVAVLTLAFGIGATTAIFSVVDAVMLRPLPYPAAERLVRVESVLMVNGQGSVASYPDFLDWRARSSVFDGMAVFRTKDFTLIGPREPLHLQGAIVSARLFSLLGVRPATGRDFLPSEDDPASLNGAGPVILSHGLWQREFGSDPSLLGRTIQLGDRPFTIIGIMPRAFGFPLQSDSVELWTTIAVDSLGGANSMTAQRGAHYLDVIGLLKPGVVARQAQAEMAAIVSALNKQHPENKPRSVRIVPELTSIVGDLRTPLLLLMGAVVCVLLIVCANVANLLLARSTGRLKEMAVRAALGASRSRSVCQLITESVALGLLGGAVGLALAVALLKVLAQLIPPEVPRIGAIGLDTRLVLFAFLISLLSGILSGLAPVMRISEIRLTDSLKGSARGQDGESRWHAGLRDTLVVSEVALAVALLLGAGLMIQSLVRLTRVDPGFNPDHILTFALDSPAGKPLMHTPAFFREVVTRIGALSGVRSASAVAALPLTGHNITAGVEIEGQPTRPEARPVADFNAVEPNYFRTLGIALVEGRDFSEHDDLTSTPVVIVNRTLARRFFPNQDPIGKHVTPGIGNGYGPGGPPRREIVGVIADVKQGGLGTQPAPEVYAPTAQCPFSPMFIVVRTDNDPQSMIGAARGQVVSLDAHLPLYHVRTLDQYRDHSISVPRSVTLFLSGFAGLALLLACLGVYGVTSCVVSQRTHEIGVRIALGAGTGEILRWVLRRGVLLALLGAAIGLAASLGLARLLSSVLYGVGASYSVIFVLAPLALLGIAVLACCVPARRATKVDPLTALRCE